MSQLPIRVGGLVSLTPTLSRWEREGYAGVGFLRKSYSQSFAYGLSRAQ